MKTKQLKIDVLIKIRPAVAKDGGIKFKSFENGEC